VKDKLASAIKEFCEDALTTGNTQFSYVALVEYAMARVPGSDRVLVGDVVGELFTRGEINTICMSHDQGIYQVVPPQQPQAVALGVTSTGGVKRKAFTKKQKKAALDAITPIIAALPQYPEQYQQQHGEGIKCLHDWLKEQV